MADKAEGASPAPLDEKPEGEAAVAAEAVAASDANSAESSAAGDTDAKETPPSLLDVVKDVLEPKAAEESSTPEGEQEARSEGEAKVDEAAAKSDDDFSDVPFHEHPRFKQVIAERNEFKEDAGQYRQMITFMDHHGLSGEEVGEGFEVMARLKSGDPEQLRQALEWFEPRVQALRETLGVVLPTDLQQRVDDGLLDADAAKELAEARAAGALREKQDEARSQAAQEAVDLDRQREATQAVVTAVSGWEAETRKADPDYAKKAELVETALIAIIAKEGAPATPEAAVAVTQRAYDQVQRAMKAALPKRVPVDTTTPAGSSAHATAAPTTLRGALEASLAGST